MNVKLLMSAPSLSYCKFLYNSLAVNPPTPQTEYEPGSRAQTCLKLGFARWTRRRGLPVLWGILRTKESVLAGVSLQSTRPARCLIEYSSILAKPSSSSGVVHEVLLMLSGWGTVFYLCAADADVEWESSSCPSANCDSFCTPERFCPPLCSLNTPAGSWTLRVLFKCVI